MTTGQGNAARRMRELNMRARQERDALADTLAVTGERLRPAKLASDASDRVADAMLDAIAKARTAAREHPIKAVGIAAAIGAFLARRPLSRLIAEGLGSAWTHIGSRIQPDVAEDHIAEETEESDGTRHS